MGYVCDSAAAVYSEMRWFEDFSHGQCFSYGHWLMAAEQMQAFAELYDPEPFHLDNAAASQLGWGEGIIASGLQITAIWRRLSKEAFPNVATVISPGWDEIRWLKPVYAGDLLGAQTDIAEVRRLNSRPGEGMVILRNRITRSPEQQDTVATLSSTWFVRCRPDSVSDG